MECRLLPLNTIDAFSVFSNLYTALSTAPYLVTLWIPKEKWLLNSIRQIASNPSLQRIRVNGFDSLSVFARQFYIEQAKQKLDARMFALFDFPDEG